MSKFLFPLFLLLLISSLYAQSSLEQIFQSNGAFRREINEEYANPEKSPLKEEDLKSFDGLPFYDIDPAFHVTAKFKRAKKTLPFKMETTTTRRPVYEIYGAVTFHLNGKKYVLNIYQSHSLRQTEEYKNYLFLPFTDLTNGKETYGGGRYIDLTIPEGKKIIIDFNRAYNPYCAYNNKYSCPIVPQENYLETEIKAGVKYGKLFIRK